MIDSLFEILDLNNGGVISRSELHRAAKRLGWDWYEAPIFALLDLLTIGKPLSRNQFNAFMQQIKDDPMGPYGRVLLNSPHFSSTPPAWPDQSISLTPQAEGTQPQEFQGYDFEGNLRPEQKQTPGADISNNYRRLLTSLDKLRISAREAALLIIDPQRSFTRGAWMQSIGDGAVADVKPIVTAFNNCAALLKMVYGRMEVMFTRCPFPPGSYNWDDSLAPIVDSNQLYFIKPGNSVIFPPFNGFNEWMDRCINRGKGTLVIGGCTLNSCIRVSASEILNRLKDQNLQVIVDLTISGARSRNFMPSPLYDGLSAVESAVHQMTEAGVRVVRRVQWKKN